MKKVSAIVIIALILSLTTAAIAAGINGDYKGNPIANVIINGVKLVFPDVPAIGYNGRTMMPLRACVESVNGIVEWDNATQTATVIKPETSVYFFLFNDDGKTIYDAYSVIPVSGENKKFYSSVDVSGIPAGTYTIKCEIVNQAGTVVAHTEDTSVEIKNDGDIFTSYTEWDSFQVYKETYKFKIYMKDKAGTYKTIATKTMRYE